MNLQTLVTLIADALKEYDSEKPVHKHFRPGIGPFGEPQLVGSIAERLVAKGIDAKTKRTPDLAVTDEWAVEFKIVRPFGDNGREAENWSVNMLHPYAGNVSLIGDSLKLARLSGYQRKGLVVLGFEHDPAIITLDPLIHAFEIIALQVLRIDVGERVEARRAPLVHPEHQVLRCMAWEVKRGLVEVESSA